MVIGDDNLGPFKVRKHVIGDQFTALVVTVRVIRLEDAQAITDCYTRCDNEKATSELFTVWPTYRVDCLPDDQHSHDSGLACACGEFQGKPH